MILAITVLILFTILDVIADFWYITNNSKLWHAAKATSRSLVICYVIYVNYGLSLKSIEVIVFILSVYWIVFDVSINKIRGKEIFYVGSGNIDILVKKIAKKINFNHEVLMMIFKIVTITISTILLIGY